MEYGFSRERRGRLLRPRSPRALLLAGAGALLCGYALVALWSRFNPTYEGHPLPILGRYAQGGNLDARRLLTYAAFTADSASLRDAARRELIPVGMDAYPWLHEFSGLPSFQEVVREMAAARSGEELLTALEATAEVRRLAHADDPEALKEPWERQAGAPGKVPTDPRSSWTQAPGGGPPLAAFSRCLGSTDPWTRFLAAQALVPVGLADEELAALLQDPLRHVRRLAVMRVADRAATFDRDQARAEEVRLVNAVRQLLVDGDPEVRVRAAVLLARLTAAAPGGAAPPWEVPPNYELIEALATGLRYCRLLEDFESVQPARRFGRASRALIPAVLDVGNEPWPPSRPRADRASKIVRTIEAHHGRPGS